MSGAPRRNFTPSIRTRCEAEDDATIAQLRAEVERLTRERDEARAEAEKERNGPMCHYGWCAACGEAERIGEVMTAPKLTPERLNALRIEANYEDVTGAEMHELLDAYEALQAERDRYRAALEEIVREADAGYNHESLLPDIARRALAPDKETGK
jgi:hypothetical protein